MQVISKNQKNWEFSYLLAMPSDIKDGEKLPLIAFLHGAGERGDNPMDLTRHAVPKLFKDGCPVRAIMVAPQCPDGQVWKMNVKELKSFLDKILNEYPIDKDKVALTGISMGGYGTWDMAETYPDLFSAIAVVCGCGDVWRCETLKNMPIRVFHGDKDPLVPIAFAYEIVDKLICLGGSPEFTVFHNVTHNSWDLAYETTDLLQWLIKQDRKNWAK